MGTRSGARAAGCWAAAKLLTEEKERLSRFVSREVGKPLREARGSVQKPSTPRSFFQSEGRRLYANRTESSTDKRAVHVAARWCLGLITAANFPIAVPSWKSSRAFVRERPRLEPSADAPAPRPCSSAAARAGVPSAS